MAIQHVVRLDYGSLDHGHAAAMVGTLARITMALASGATNLRVKCIHLRYLRLLQAVQQPGQLV
ncbi:hypothetical protein [Sulfobacillus harzensis]|uniref:Uncharacterized protein n=1 Tax=Sulfobacillus harzensis TaxID=2729629 RepID=A0A7Y0Q4I7_9FIRM|nr:hypothetical protein [Sulfobacillus harzensis]NMP24455.1 hypothetical protein [Sulfobacillus harzensis]